VQSWLDNTPLEPIGQCRRIAETEELGSTLGPMGAARSIFPVPAGGMRLDRVSQMCAFYGPDVILLIGGDLQAHGRDLVASCRRFFELARHSSESGAMRSM